jgi:hypothetical protein
MDRIYRKRGKRAMKKSEILYNDIWEIPPKGGFLLWPGLLVGTTAF